MYLIRVALIIYDHYSHLEKVAALLGKMERSEGFSRFEKRTNNPHNSKMKLTIE